MYPLAVAIRFEDVPTRALRVTYWTGWLSPDLEGGSKDVFALTGHFSRSRIFGLSRYYIARLSLRQRYIGLHVRFYPLFRLLAPWFDRTSDVNHIYGSLDEWFFLRALRRRPIVLTVATANTPPDLSMHSRVACFVTHSSRTTAELVARGVPAERIRLIYPGLDLTRFAARPAEAAGPDAWPASPTRRFRILFATTPNTGDGLTERGVHLLLEAAARLPDVEFFLPWRPWPAAPALIDRLIAQHRPGNNVHLRVQVVPDMRRLYRAADATIAPFLRTEGTKICPTSLVESLASGRPVLVSTAVGIADLIRGEGGGEVFEPTVDGVCAAIASLRGNYATRAAEAGACASRHFDERLCFIRHEQLYMDAAGIAN